MIIGIDDYRKMGHKILFSFFAGYWYSKNYNYMKFYQYLCIIYINNISIIQNSLYLFI